MGWKNIKDHYRIGHIVQIREGKIAIGSGYVHDLIRITFDGQVSWGNLGPSSNDDLARYYEEMSADLSKLKELIDAPDTFGQSLPVYTYDGAEILEKQCEGYGWPNVTHDGCLMYDNSYSLDKKKVVQWAKRNADASVELTTDRIAEIRNDLTKAEARLARAKDARARLELDYPTGEA